MTKLAPDALTHEVVSIDSLTSFPNNARQGDVGAIIESLKFHGQYRPLVVQASTRVVLAGNHTLEAARQLGWSEIAVTLVDVSDDQARRINVADNRANDLASYNDQTLVDLLRDMPDLEGTLFDAEDFDQLLADLNEPFTANDALEDDALPEVPEKAITKPGDLWTLGAHRLICADASDRDAVSRLMDGERAQVLITSPPYADARDYEAGSFDWDALMRGVFAVATAALADDASILVNLGLVHRKGRLLRYWDAWLDYMESELGQPLHDWYVWDKLSGLIQSWGARFVPAHEWVFHFGAKPRKIRKTKRTQYAEQGITHYSRDKVLRQKDGSLRVIGVAGEPVNQSKVADSVIRAQPARGGVEGHPAPFSIAFVAELIEPFADKGEIVFEPFAGAGSTLIACEKLQRRCFGIEIEPKYVDVVLRRWQRLTNRKPLRDGVEVDFG